MNPFLVLAIMLVSTLCFHIWLYWFIADTRSFRKNAKINNVKGPL